MIDHRSLSRCARGDPCSGLGTGLDHRREDCDLHALHPERQDGDDYVVNIIAPAGTSDIQRLRLGEIAMGISRGQWSERHGQ